VPIPTGVRKSWVIQAAKAKKHVMCEKPCSGSLKDTRGGECGGDLYIWSLVPIVNTLIKHFVSFTKFSFKLKHFHGSNCRNGSSLSRQWSAFHGTQLKKDTRIILAQGKSPSLYCGTHIRRDELFCWCSGWCDVHAFAKIT
jgi:hypothetical protein